MGGWWRLVAVALATATVVLGAWLLVGWRIAEPAPSPAAWVDPAPATADQVDPADPIMPTLTDAELTSVFGRRGWGPQGISADVFYAPPIFFQLSGEEIPRASLERPTVSFLLYEADHEHYHGLTPKPPQVLAWLDSGYPIEPYQVTVLQEGDDHRTSWLLFPMPPGMSQETLDQGQHTLTFSIPLESGERSSFTWKLPLDLPEVAARPVGQRGASVALEWRDVLSALLRAGTRPEGTQPSVNALLASPIYFDMSGRMPPQEAAREPSLLFYVSEDSHGHLPAVPPQPFLRIDGGAAQYPVAVDVLADSDHHRTAAIRYSAVSAGGSRLVTQGSGLLELVFPAPEGALEPSLNVLSWRLPIDYGKGISSREVALGLPAGASGSPRSQVGSSGPAGAALPALGGDGLTLAAILALLGGMLLALSPCLTQLGVYYAATLAGVSTEAGSQGFDSMAAARRHVIQTGLFFTLGFTLVYTAGGAAAGFVGESLGTLGPVSAWMRPLSIAAGIVILVMALRVAWNARAPLVCHLPMAGLFGAKRRTGPLGSIVMGISFAGGCLACFSATVLPALLLYAGATASVTYGALLLLVFSLGITLPCLALAFGVSRFQPFLRRLQNTGPLLGMTSAMMMAVFGIIMVTDQFHLVSGLIYRLMGLT
ncbi:MAG: cytochrome c biogenesis protein CcdA [Dehalococcoidia bacterium]|nr:cytochrome c biogenesis protein CcdA [Dehalococcoidia bacterium]